MDWEDSVVKDHIRCGVEAAKLYMRATKLSGIRCRFTLAAREKHYLMCVNYMSVGGIRELCVRHADDATVRVVSLREIEFQREVISAMLLIKAELPLSVDSPSRLSKISKFVFSKYLLINICLQP